MPYACFIYSTFPPTNKYPPILHYWSDRTEIFTQCVKSKKKHFLFPENFLI